MDTLLEGKGELFLNRLASFVEQTQSRAIYNIKPEYGDGRIFMYKIMKGMYLYYSEFTFKDIIKNSIKSNYGGDFIAIEYCIEGEYTCTLENNRVCYAQKSNSSYSLGENSFKSLDFKGKLYKSIRVLLYLNEITDLVDKIFEGSKEKIVKYYHKLSRIKEPLIIRLDNQVIALIDEIYKSIKNNNIEQIKLLAIELFLLEINNYENYNTRKKKYYAKSLVDKIERIRNAIDENYNKNITIKELAEKEEISATSLKMCFKDVYGDTIYAYKKRCRMQKAIDLLLETDYKVYEIASIVGYQEVAMFTKAFKKAYNMTPTKYRKIRV